MNRKVESTLIIIGFLALLVSVTFVVVASLRLDLGEDREVLSERPLPEFEPLLKQPVFEGTAPTPVQPSTSLLSVIEGAFWRTNGGTCEPGRESENLLLERSSDGGQWVDITPVGFDIREIVFLQGIQFDVVEIVGLVSDECQPVILRSFTAGQFWKTYQESMVGAVFIDSDVSAFQQRFGVQQLPCEPPLKTVSGQSGELINFICSDHFAWFHEGQWSYTNRPGLIAAGRDPDSNQLATISLDSRSCVEGHALEIWDVPGSQRSQQCIAIVDITAVHRAGVMNWLWHAEGLELIETE